MFIAIHFMSSVRNYGNFDAGGCQNSVLKTKGDTYDWQVNWRAGDALPPSGRNRMMLWSSKRVASNEMYRLSGLKCTCVQENISALRMLWFVCTKNMRLLQFGNELATPKLDNLTWNWKLTAHLYRSDTRKISKLFVFSKFSWRKKTRMHVTDRKTVTSKGNIIVIYENNNENDLKRT